MDFMVGDNMDLNISIPSIKSNARANGSFYWDTGKGFSIKVNWATTPNVSGGYTKVEASLNIVGASARGTCQAGSHITINGNESSFANKSLSFDGVSGKEYILHYHSVNVSHTGAINVSMSGKWVWNGFIWVEGSYSGNFTSVSGTGTIPCAALLTPPGAPTNLSLTGRFDNGMTTQASWTKGTGTIEAYEVQRRFWTAYDNAYSDWSNVNSNYSGSATSITIQHSAVTHHSQQVRIRAKNAAGTSSWVESNWVGHDGVNVYTNNSGTKTYGKVRVWNGSAWVQGYMSVWTGSAWSTTK